MIIDHRQKKRNDRRPDRLKEKAPVAQFNLNSCKMKKINSVGSKANVYEILLETTFLIMKIRLLFLL